MINKDDWKDPCVHTHAPYIPLSFMIMRRLHGFLAKFSIALGLRPYRRNVT